MNLTDCELHGIGCDDGSPPPEGGETPATGDEGTDITVDKEYLIKEKQSAYDNWKIIGGANISGKKFINNSLNYITNCSGTGSVLWCFGNSPNCMDPIGPLFVLFSELHHSGGLINSQQGFANHQTKVVYPNFPGGAQTQYYNGSHVWFAASDL